MHLEIRLNPQFSIGEKPTEADYKDAACFIKRHLPIECGFKVDAVVVREENQQ